MDVENIDFQFPLSGSQNQNIGRPSKLSWTFQFPLSGSLGEFVKFRFLIKLSIPSLGITLSGGRKVSLL